MKTKMKILMKLQLVKNKKYRFQEEYQEEKIESDNLNNCMNQLPDFSNRDNLI